MRPRTLAVCTTATLLLTLTAPAAAAASDDRAVARWAARTAAPAAHIAPAVGDATVVGLGEQVHGAKEVLQLKLRALRVLVERKGFRSLAWEDDWTLGLEVDRWLETGAGDVRALVGQMSAAHRNREVLRTLEWLRAYNVAHPRDRVSFVGVEYWTTRHSAYDAVRSYVARHAPDRLPEAGEHLDFLTPPGDEIGDWPQVYGGLSAEDKQPYLEHARALRALIAGLPHARGDRRHALAAHHARQIRNFYEHYAVWPNFEYRDAHVARNLRWWQRYSGDKVAYWAANAHTAVAPTVEFHVDDRPAAAWASVGSFMDSWYGDDYVSIGFTLGSGSYYEGQVRPLPPAADAWFEDALAGVPLEQFSLDLAARSPQAVRRWLTATARTRGLPEYGLASHMEGGSVGEWFDALVHRRVVGPAAPL
ncbi:MAG TPA: erythromycin esterase family protein [Nocardioides sp.]|nr:erythromycin esterase family protein [Nocardioides sp.]